MNYDWIYERDSSLSKIAGMWSEIVNGFTTTLTIQNNGSFDGSDTGGCVFNGKISIIDPDFNLSEVKLQASNCGTSTGSFHGDTALIDTDAANDTLPFAVSSEQFIEIGEPRRQ